MRQFRCPKCGADVVTLALEVAHRCHFNRNRMTQWNLVSEEDPAMPKKAK